MNANELADRLDYINRGEKTLDEAATMLRTIPAMQDEIEQLKYDLSVNENYLLLERQYSEKLWKQLNPLQDKLDAIANKVVFGKAQEK